MKTYTTEEVERWVEYLKQEELLPIPSHVNHPAHGIAAWKARREAKDEDAAFLRKLSFHKIADRLEALRKERGEMAKELAQIESLMFGGFLQDTKDDGIAYRVFNEAMAIKKERDQLQKRIAELEENADDWQIREEMARKQAEKQPDADGWIPYKAGDPMPCHPKMKIQILCRDNYKCNCLGEHCHWDELKESTITHWRPAK